MTAPTILQNATPAQLERAAALNHRELFCLGARCAGGEVREANGVTWTYAGPRGDSMVAFPSLAENRAGAQLDEIVGYYLGLSYVPRGLVGCWSLDPPRPPDLGVRLLARGFQVGWRPCWMALDLDRVRTDHPRPEGLRVEADGESSFLNMKHLPYAQVDEPCARPDLQERYRDRLRRFVAVLDGRVVGQSTVFLTEGPLGAAGIYDVGVEPEARNRGIGKAVTLAACLVARERGYRYAVLNATDLGRPAYERLGFEWLGDGWTWWLNVPRLAARLPTLNRIALAEAVGRGDVPALDLLGAHLSNDDLQAPLANEMTLMQLAVHCRQFASAEWLIARGTELEVLEAWDLGWRERAAQLLRDRPERVNRRYGEWKLTLLHEAASRGDLDLARLALSAHPDLSIKDEAHQSTPLGWARFFKREEIVRLLSESGD